MRTPGRPRRRGPSARRRCRGGPPPGRRCRVPRTSRRPTAVGTRGSSARPRVRHRRPSPRPAPAARCRVRSPRRHRRRPRSRRRGGSVPTPGSTTASTTPDGTYPMHRASASDPARTSNGGISWVRSMTADVRRDVADHGTSRRRRTRRGCRSRSGARRCRSDTTVHRSSPRPPFVTALRSRSRVSSSGTLPPA